MCRVSCSSPGPQPGRLRGVHPGPARVREPDQAPRRGCAGRPGLVELPGLVRVRVCMVTLSSEPNRGLREGCVRFQDSRTHAEAVVPLRGVNYAVAGVSHSLQRHVVGLIRPCTHMPTLPRRAGIGSSGCAAHGPRSTAAKAATPTARTAAPPVSSRSTARRQASIQHEPDRQCGMRHIST